MIAIAGGIGSPRGDREVAEVGREHAAPGWCRRLCSQPEDRKRADGEQPARYGVRGRHGERRDDLRADVIPDDLAPWRRAVVPSLRIGSWPARAWLRGVIRKNRGANATPIAISACCSPLPNTPATAIRELTMNGMVMIEVNEAQQRELDRPSDECREHPWPDPEHRGDADHLEGAEQRGSRAVE